MREPLRKIIEDRLVIKTTQKLRRHIQPREITQFFINNKYKIEKVETEFLKAMDKLINEFLEKKQ